MIIKTGYGELSFCGLVLFMKNKAKCIQSYKFNFFFFIKSS